MARLISGQKNFVRRLVQVSDPALVDVATISKLEQAIARNIVATALGESLSKVGNPVSFVRFIADSLAHNPVPVKILKGNLGIESTSQRRFATYLDLLKRGTPILNFAIARDIASHVDSISQLRRYKEFFRWAGDIGIHSSGASSDPAKGRIIAAAIRAMRPTSCLELGTCYGVSAYFILSELEQLAEGGQLHTVEFSELQFEISSSSLKSRFQSAVTSHNADIEKQLDTIAKGMAPIDFVFHDANHRGDNYIRDFDVLLPHLKPGALVLLDDIDWKNPHVSQSLPTYDAWKRIADHNRVEFAAEVMNIGIALIK
ncbi:MAG: O-methyltransferase [Planctomycetota bacterium]